jgi:hypothetical protein
MLMYGSHPRIGILHNDFHAGNEQHTFLDLFAYASLASFSVCVCALRVFLSLFTWTRLILHLPCPGAPARIDANKKLLSYINAALLASVPWMQVGTLVITVRSLF